MKEQQIKNVEKDLLEPIFSYFMENGLENISIRDICKNVGVSSGSLYYWFKGKRDMVYTTIIYGLEKIVKSLLNYAQNTISTPEVFFDNIINEVDKHKKGLRLLFQVTSSPIYGEKVRENAHELKAFYSECSIIFAQVLNTGVEVTSPMIYMLLSIIADYVVWEDTEASKMQLKFLCEVVVKHMEENKGM